MKVKVVEKFKDAKTGEIHTPGRVIDLDEQRAKKAAAAKLVAYLEKPKKSGKEE